MSTGAASPLNSLGGSGRHSCRPPRPRRLRFRPASSRRRDDPTIRRDDHPREPAVCERSRRTLFGARARCIDLVQPHAWYPEDGFRIAWNFGEEYLSGQPFVRSDMPRRIVGHDPLAHALRSEVYRRHGCVPRRRGRRLLDRRRRLNVVSGRNASGERAHECERSAHHGRSSTHTAPSGECSFFHIGAICFRRSIA